MCIMTKEEIRRFLEGQSHVQLTQEQVEKAIAESKGKPLVILGRRIEEMGK